MSHTLEILIDAAAFLAAIIWPMAIFLIAYLYRDGILQLLQKIPGRISKLGIGGFSIELAQVREFEHEWFGPGVVNLRKTGSSDDVNDSTARTFIEQIRHTTPLDYAVVNLGGGKEWLTSRLYILSIILKRMRNTKAFVFVEKSGDVRRQYVGSATCEQVRWAFALRFNWLEQAFATAYGQIDDFSIVSSKGKLAKSDQPSDPLPAINLMQNFLNAIQTLPVPSPADDEEWIVIKKEPELKEHAAWLTASMLEEIMGNELDTESVPSHILSERTELQKIELIEQISGNYLALTRADGRFESLIDRSQVIENTVTALIQRK